MQPWGKKMGIRSHQVKGKRNEEPQNAEVMSKEKNRGIFLLKYQAKTHVWDLWVVKKAIAMHTNHVVCSTELRIVNSEEHLISSL